MTLFSSSEPIDFARVARTDWKGAFEFVLHNLPEGDFARIAIKPNWVLHQAHDEFPISALVTDSRLIGATIEACLRKYQSVREIRVGDVPLQSCDWDLLRTQAGIDKLEERYCGDERAKITFTDLRRERWRVIDGFMQLDDSAPGDPLGYAEVVLDRRSMLDEISRNANRFRVSDYDPQETVSKHRSGEHRYLVARSLLDVDLFINLPKMKTHQKSGITGALKNLVGINGSKAYLVHHQKGRPSQGGDEFPESASRMLQLQTALREFLQKRSRLAFRALKGPWEMYKRLTGLSTVGTRAAVQGKMYVGSGSWYGNDSIWRMTYDLNMVIRFARSSGGTLADSVQRRTISIIDGIISGEGNGPLQPLPVKSGVLIAAVNPFLADAVMARLMGFDWRRIPLVANSHRFADPLLAQVDLETASVQVDCEQEVTLDSLPIVHNYLAPPGWRGHVELSEQPA